MGTFSFTQKAFIVHENKLLMVKKSKDDPKNPNKWEIPGGRMEFGESVEEHLIREVKEEVGLDIRVGEPFAIWTRIIENQNASGDMEEVQIVAVASMCTTDSTTIDASGQVEDDFLSDVRWVPLDEVMDYDLMPDITPAVEKFLAKLVVE